MKYQITKKQAQTQINELNNVCDRCGRKLIPLKTVDNSNNPTYWVGCYHGKDGIDGAWGTFTNGVKKDVYKLAYKLVLEDGLYLNMEKDEGSDFDYLFQNGVSKVVQNCREY